MAYFTETPEGTILNVKAQPRSSKTGVDGLIGDKELVETLAEAFGLPKGKVVFKSGETSKQKRILLTGVSADMVKNVVGA